VHHGCGVGVPAAVAAAVAAARRTAQVVGECNVILSVLQQLLEWTSIAGTMIWFTCPSHDS